MSNYKIIQKRENNFMNKKGMLQLLLAQKKGSKRDNYLIYLFQLLLEKKIFLKFIIFSKIMKKTDDNYLNTIILLIILPNIMCMSALTLLCIYHFIFEFFQQFFNNSKGK